MKTATEGLTKKSLLAKIAGKSATGRLNANRMSRSWQLATLADDDVVTAELVEQWYKGSSWNGGNVTLRMGETELTNRDLERIAWLIDSNVE
jgi:hypothetical protein